jgi:hypothetical protein
MLAAVIIPAAAAEQNTKRKELSIRKKFGSQAGTEYKLACFL